MVRKLVLVAVVVVLAYAFVLHEQLADHPWIAQPHELWREASEALGVPIKPSVSIARNQPFFVLGAPLAAMMTLILSFVACADGARARQLLKVVAWSGVAYDAYGIISFLLEPSMLLWRETAAWASAPQTLTGTVAPMATNLMSR